MKWIKIKDQLPPDGTLILMHVVDQTNKVWGIYTGYHFRQQWWYEGGRKIEETSEATHWMSFPAPPEKEPL
jgi:hypothetical protein